MSGPSKQRLAPRRPRPSPAFADDLILQLLCVGAWCLEDVVYFPSLAAWYEGRASAFFQAACFAAHIASDRAETPGPTQAVAVTLGCFALARLAGWRSEYERRRVAMAAEGGAP